MNGKKFGWELAYYLLTIIVYWVMVREERGDPPLKTTVLYYVYRGSQALARKFGRVGLAAEHAYHVEIEKVRSV